MAGETGMGIGSGLLEAGINQATNQQQFQQEQELMSIQHANQQDLNQQGHDLQFKMWQKTNFPAQVRMMKAAGLNPALMYKGAGPGGTTGSQSGGAASKGSAPQAWKANPQTLMMGMELKALEAGIEGQRIENQKNAIERDRMLGKDDIGYGKQEVALMNANEQKALKEAAKQGEEMRKLRLENLMTLEVWEERVNKEIWSAINEANDAKLKESQAKLNDEQRKYISKNFNIIAKNLELEIEKTGILKYNAESQRMEADAKQIDTLTKKIELQVREKIAKMDIDQRQKEMWVKFGSNLIRDLLGFIPNMIHGEDSEAEAIDALTEAWKNQ